MANTSVLCCKCQISASTRRKMRFILLIALFCGSAVLAVDQQSSDAIKAQDLHNVKGSDEIAAIGNNERRPQEVPLNTVPEPQVAEIVGGGSSESSSSSSSSEEEGQEQGPPPPPHHGGPPPPPHHGGPPSPPQHGSNNSPGHHGHPAPAKKSHEAPHSEADSKSSSEEVADGKKGKKKKEGFRKKVVRKIKEKARKLKNAFHRHRDSSSSQENEEKKNKKHNKK